MHRQEISLLQVCRQINVESKPLLGSYTTAHMHCDSVPSSPGVIYALWAFLDRYFRTVHTLEFSQAAAKALHYEMNYPDLYRQVGGRSRHKLSMAQRFSSLQTIILPLEIKRQSDVQGYRKYFCKPDLEVIYNYYNP